MLYSVVAPPHLLDVGFGLLPRCHEEAVPSISSNTQTPFVSTTPQTSGASSVGKPAAVAQDAPVGDAGAPADAYTGTTADATTAGGLTNGSPGGGNVMATRMAALLGTLEPKIDTLATSLPATIGLNALKLAEAGEGGKVFRLDGGKVSGQRVVLRAIRDADGREGIEMRLKVRGGDNRSAIQSAMQDAGGVDAKFREETRTFENGVYTTDATNGIDQKNTSIQLKTDDGVIDFHPNGEQAIKGTMRLRVYGDEASLRGKLDALLQKAGATALVEDSAPDTQKLALGMQVLWQSAPEAARALEADGALTADALNTALAEIGTTLDDAAALPVMEVFPGRFAPVDRTQGEKYAEMGIRYLFAGVRLESSVLAILKGDGLMSTNERYARGKIIKGASSASDIRTGGADYVFTRMVPENAVDEKISRSYGAGAFQLVYSTEVLDRTDWFAYPKDNYGNTMDDAKFLKRTSGKELVDELNTGRWSSDKWKHSNEVMFRTGIPNKQLKAIFAKSESDRTSLIASLKADGFDTYNGVPVEEFVQTRTTHADAV